jgi:hypothetical protein
MTQAGTIAAQGLLGKLQATTTGVRDKLSGLAEQAAFELPVVELDQIQARNIAAEVHERSTPFKYPVVFVYSDRIKNEQKEKFKKFSGTVSLVVEIRVTQDVVENVEAQLGAYVDSVTSVLEESRGNWANCVYYAGAYEVVFEPVKRGGTGFSQRAKVTLPVHVSVE